jgi:hypothetical protein
MKRKALSLIALAAIATGSLSFAASPQDGPKPRPWMSDNEEPGTYTAEWDGRPDPDRGACFYTDPAFTGHHFCIVAGQRMNALPKGFGDKITSLRTFGGGEVTVYSHKKFSGHQAVFNGEITDLGDTTNRRNWNDKISSISVH